MRRFAKLFEVTVPGNDELHQVLVLRTTDAQDDPIVTVTCQLPHVSPTMSLGFDEVTDRDAAYEKFDETNAQEFMAQVLNL